MADGRLEMIPRSMIATMRRGSGVLALGLAIMVTAACGMAGFGGGLQLNITDRQSRNLTITVDGGATDAQLVEVTSNGENTLGTGTARIERYVVQRATFGSGVAVGYFLCPKPCTNPLSAYLVAYSPDQLFTADGQLDLRFRVVRAAGGSEELTRSISAEMLPALFDNPTIEAKSGGR